MNQELNNQPEHINTEPINEVNNNESKISETVSNIHQEPIQPMNQEDNNTNNEVPKIPLEEVVINKPIEVQTEINNQSAPINVAPVNELNNSIQKNEPVQSMTLEDNIIRFDVPENKVTEIIQPDYGNQPTPIPEVSVVEYNQKTENVSPMKESIPQENNKKPISLFIIFGIFIALIIGLPYIDEFISKMKSDDDMKQTNTTTEPKTTTEPVIEPTEEPEMIPESYKSCGTNQVFKIITIDYTINQTQCFKINLGNEKTIIKYVPSENGSWNIQLGDKNIYSGDSQVTISTINITDTNQIQLVEKNTTTQIEKVYTYDNNGEQIKEVMQ